MATKGISPVLVAGVGVGALYLFSGSGSNPLSSLFPGSSTSSTLPGNAIVSTSYGVNDGTGAVANYNQLIQANPNLANPNYQMSANENAQYLANYLDLQQGLPLWVGHKQANGMTPQNLQQAAQVHWTIRGVAEKRIFLPLQPPSGRPYTPPPSNSGSSGSSSWIGPAISTAGTILVSLLGPGQPDPKLNDGELELLFTGGAILKDIVPMFYTNDAVLAKMIDQQFTAMLIPYTS